MNEPSRLNKQGNRRGRPFPPGSGGRPKGSRNRRTVLAERLMQDDLEAIVLAVTAAARGGDMAAAKIILDRLAPIRRGRPVQFALPGGVDAAGMAEAFGSLLQAISSGELTPEEGQAVASVLEIRRKAIETVEIEARLAALEQAKDEKGHRR